MFGKVDEGATDEQGVVKSAERGFGIVSVIQGWGFLCKTKSFISGWLLLFFLDNLE